jgi:O-antigen/teichoic acid export membrane protein
VTGQPPPTGNGQPYFDTTGIKEDLRAKTVRGGAWAAAAQVAKSMLQIASIMVLARMLSPTDFGLIGMVVAVTGFIAMFQDLGLSMATVQRENITHEQISNLFWINLGLSAATMLVTAAIAPVLAWYYEEPRLTVITLSLAGAFIFGGLSVQHCALLKRQMRFGALAVIELSALAAGIGTAVALAVLDCGYWSLVGQQIVAMAVTAAGCWALCGWRPGMPRRGCGIGALVAFGGNLTGFSVVNYFARNLDQVLLGRFYGPLAVGLYQKAYDILLIPLRQINEPVSSVAIPVLSRLADQPERYRRTYLRLLEKILLITMPMGAFLIMTSDWLVLLVLGEQWIETGYIFAALGVAIFTQPIGNSTGWLFISQNRTHHFLRWGFIGSGTAVASFIIGLPWGAFGVALAYSLIGLLVRKPLLIWYVTRQGPIRPMDFLRVAAPHALVAVAVAAALGGFRLFGPACGPMSGLLSAAAICLPVALGTLAALPGGRAALQDAAQVVAGFRRNRKGAEDPPAPLASDGGG